MYNIAAAIHWVVVICVLRTDSFIQTNLYSLIIHSLKNNLFISFYFNLLPATLFLVEMSCIEGWCVSEWILCMQTPIASSLPLPLLYLSITSAPLYHCLLHSATEDPTLCLYSGGVGHGERMSFFVFISQQRKKLQGLPEDGGDSLCRRLYGAVDWLVPKRGASPTGRLTAQYPRLPYPARTPSSLGIKTPDMEGHGNRRMWKRTN